METRANYAMIGAFVLMASFAVAGFVLWLGGSQLRQDFKSYDVVFEGPVSLEQSASVRYIGIKVGEVEWVRIDRADPSKVRTRIKIDRETPVKTDTKASIELAGITGTTFIQLTAGTVDARSLEAKAGQPVPVIESEQTQLAALVSGGAQILGDASKALGRVNDVLTKENIESLEVSIQNLEAITTMLAQSDGLVSQAASTLNNVSDAAMSFDEAAKSIDKFSKNADAQMSGINGDVQLLLADLRRIADSAEGTVEESGRAVTAATQAIEGPATSALEDASIASRDLRKLILRLDRLARDIESNPQSLVAGKPVPYEESRR